MKFICTYIFTFIELKRDPIVIRNVFPFPLFIFIEKKEKFSLLITENQ